jgi:hypothetical protein
VCHKQPHPSLEPPQVSLHLRLGKVPVAVIDSLELAAINGDKLLREQVKIPAQQHELPTDVSYADAIVIAEVGNRLEVRTNVRYRCDNSQRDSFT